MFDKLTLFIDQYCWGHGGFLAELKSEDVDLAIDKHLSSDEYYWIGATDVAMEGGEDALIISQILCLYSHSKAPSSGQRVTRPWITTTGGRVR